MATQFAVIFKTKRELPIPSDYLEVNKRMVEIVSKLPGYLGGESVSNSDGFGISISYWSSLEAIKS